MAGKLANLARKLRRLLQFAVEYLADARAYIVNNQYSPFVDRRKRQFYRIIIEAHTIEKGLSLEHTRPLFGRTKIAMLRSMLAGYDASYSPVPAAMAFGAMDGYREFHRARGIDGEPVQAVERILAAPEVGEGYALAGGWKDITGAHERFDHEQAKAFLASRSSCRMYAPAPVPRELLDSVVRLAQRTPSQCNRQATKIHAYQERAKIEELLQLQAGSAGFLEHVPNLFVVSSDFAAWGGPQQRNQPYVDGALFAMTLLYSLHAHGLAACPLNLAIDNAKEKRIRRASGIPEDERLIVMIAFGYPSEQPAKAAFSVRRPLEEVLTVHEPSRP